MNEFESASTSALLEMIGSADSQKIVSASEELASRGEAAAAPRLLELLQTSSDANVRNAAAIALSDLKDPRAFDIVVNLLNDDRTLKSRASLLYALGAYDCRSILPLLVEFVIGGNFEVSRQALALISGIEGEVDDRTWERCIKTVRAAIPLASVERLPLLNELLSLFEQGED